MPDEDITPEVDDAQPDAPPEGDEVDADKGAEPQEFDAGRAKQKIAKANSEAANLRKRLRELEPLAAKAKELEDANKTEAEKLTDRATAAEKKATDAEGELMRLRVAIDKGLTPKQAARLVGTTEEELEADADELLESFGGTKKPASKVTGKPRENLRGGSDPDEPIEETDPRKLARLIRGK